MDKGALKRFATSARKKLIEGVKIRALRFGISEKEIKSGNQFDGLLLINGEPLEKKHVDQYQKLVERIKLYQLHKDYKEAYEMVIEEVAYTWFNRIIAIRYMEIHDYLPIRMLLLSSSIAGKKEPDAVTFHKEIVNILHLDPFILWDLAEKQQTEELFKYILIQQSRQLGQILPSAFSEVDAVEEFLLPDGLLANHGMIREMIDCGNESDWQQVEIIGWLYQYYHSEVKEKVGGLKNNQVPKRFLPTVTQIFTPKWIVQYMLQNSLGKLYDEMFPNNQLSKTWSYYLKKNIINQIVPSNVTSLEDIKLIDPACGSGHILIEAFSLFYDMYLEQGYMSKEIPNLIIKNNLHGLEIDRRSYQISHVALLLKILSYQPRLLQTRKSFDYHIETFKDTEHPISEEALLLIYPAEEIEAIRDLEKKFGNAEQFGSLINTNTIQVKPLILKIKEFLAIETEELYIQALQFELQDKLLPLLKIAEQLAQSYTIVVTNPPYHNKYNADLKLFMKKNYPTTKADLYTAFIERCFDMTVENGYTAMMTPWTWMFLSSYELLRRKLLKEGTIASLVQLERSAFEDATVSICTFVLHKQKKDILGEYVQLEQFKGSELQPIKLREAAKNLKLSYRLSKASDMFEQIPGIPICYWVNNQFKSLFSSNQFQKIEDKYEVKSGIMTGNDSTFLRLWFEVSYPDICFNATNEYFVEQSQMQKWFPISKGGNYRLYFGNNEYVIDLYKNGMHIKNSDGNYRLRDSQYYFKSGITWSRISSAYFAFRIQNEYMLFGDASPLIVQGDVELLAFLNSKVACYILKALNPTINIFVSDIQKLPISIESYPKIQELVTDIIILEQGDWNDFETSWDFKQHPFITYKSHEKELAKIYQIWMQQTEQRFEQVKRKQEELNRIFIELYDLEEELEPDILDSEVTIKKADLAKDVRSFLSYLVGVIFGRYSLDQTNIVYGGGEFQHGKYQTVQPDENNIVPITKEHYFQDDLVNKIESLVTYLFGEEHLEENLQFIAKGLHAKKSELSRECIRRYFTKEFYQDHLKIYQKRPIYWQFTSGKKGTFKGLMYIHRYDKHTLARVRTDYVLALTKTLNRLIYLAELTISENSSQRVVGKAMKEKESYLQQLEELRTYDMLLEYMAGKEIELNLDDGIKANYQKFQQIHLAIGFGNKEVNLNVFEKII
ncbi:BREX-1 system adenine-specific DNA-methyltransferase PglX [Isobaculum melis]|uniref:site-specific DNA-methyltransferase (adenine-specific) n=1 Tax=Isobaculum melis TaxID=142588 RepID=A0A1H9RLV4_9LACT|nr:BREX-1 system adenine-specific DNA-methyltransferase PglX [Isobaculum melis]SER73851.1 Methyltransferase domain-containing protein [Isobaculum melis]